MKFRTRLLAVATMLLTTLAQAALQEQQVSYGAGGTAFKGYLVWDDAIEGERPGVLVVHEWWGLNDYARERARMLAGEGYTALAVDMYGDGKSTEHPAEAGAMMQQAMADRASFQARFAAAKELLEDQATVAPDRISAIGYCFGGATVLNMARQGVDLDLVASFHGLLAANQPAGDGDIVAKVLVYNGGADPMVPAADVAAFKREMDAAGADYTFKSYPEAKHGFTNPAADRLGAANDMPLAYDADADQDSWQHLLAELKQLYGN